jgi:hypothetical protein
MATVANLKSKTDEPTPQINSFQGKREVMKKDIQLQPTLDFASIA